MSDDDDKDAAIYKVDTVPPPAGESDAYNAPTRVGPMAAAVVDEMMHAAAKKAAELTQRAEARRGEPSKGDGAGERAPGSNAPTSKAGSADVRSPSAPPQLMYEEDDDEDNAATLLSRAAKAPVVAPLPPRPFRAPPPPLPSGPTGPLGVHDIAGPGAPPAPLMPVSSPFAIAPAPPPAGSGAVEEARFAWWIPLAVGFSIFVLGAVLYVFMVTR